MKIEKVEGRFKPTADGKCALSARGMVSTAFPEATRAGVELLENGGNAIDAACAAAFALGVCEPQASGIGGQSMGILHTGDKTFCLDGSSRVPSLAHLSRVDADQLFTGYKATTVPSTPAFLGYLHFHYGRASWNEVLAPAIRIARQGYKITELQSSLQERELEGFLSVDSLSGAKYFLKGGTLPYAPGETFVQDDLADLLQLLSDKGVKEFYAGDPAREMDREMRECEGFLRLEDLALIPWPIKRKAISRTYRRLKVFTTPPPGGGRTLLLILLMLKNLPSKFLHHRSPESFHFVAETFRKALLNRKERPFDPNIYPQLPTDRKILSKEFAKMLAHSIHDDIDPTLPLVEPYLSENDTTHLSVMDNKGNAIGITQSIERVYGARTAARGMGFLYNNYMSALETKDPSHPYYLRPNAVPWSSVCPVIGFFDKKPWLVAGSPGSDRIFTAMSQFISHIADGNLPLSTAMIEPRIHCTPGGKLSFERDRFPKEIIRYLKNAGYKMDRRDSYSFFLGAVHAVIKCQTSDQFQGVAEVRRDGTAAGPA